MDSKRGSEPRLTRRGYVAVSAIAVTIWLAIIGFVHVLTVVWP